MYCLLRFVSTSIIGGECRSVWDCGDMAAAWISNTLAGKDKGLRLVYHYSDNSQRTHSPKVHFHIYLMDLNYWKEKLPFPILVPGTIWYHHGRAPSTSTE